MTASVPSGVTMCRCAESDTLSCDYCESDEGLFVNSITIEPNDKVVFKTQAPGLPGVSTDHDVIFGGQSYTWSMSTPIDCATHTRTLTSCRDIIESNITCLPSNLCACDDNERPLNGDYELDWGTTACKQDVDRFYTRITAESVDYIDDDFEMPCIPRSGYEFCVLDGDVDRSIHSFITPFTFTDIRMLPSDTTEDVYLCGYPGNCDGVRCNQNVFFIATDIVDSSTGSVLVTPDQLYSKKITTDASQNPLLDGCDTTLASAGSTRMLYPVSFGGTRE